MDEPLEVLYLSLTIDLFQNQNISKVFEAYKFLFNEYFFFIFETYHFISENKMK